jgi:hyperosmotically inducible protein
MRIRRLAASIALAAAIGLGQGNPADDRLYDQVRLKLAGDRDIGSNAIEVEVHDGVVTLKGKVAKAKQKTKAEHVARKVKGVKNVVNQLVVSP